MKRKWPSGLRWSDYVLRWTGAFSLTTSKRTECGAQHSAGRERERERETETETETERQRDRDRERLVKSGGFPNGAARW